jgi:hypothetical protein
MNKSLLDKLNELETYIRNKKNGKKICFHCENIDDFNNNLELVELFNKEIGNNNLILIGYKGSIYIKKVNETDYLYYKSIIALVARGAKNNDEKFNDLNMFYCNNRDIDIVGLGSSKIILCLVLSNVKFYFDIPYSNKNEAKNKDAKWDFYEKKWYIHRYNDNWEDFITTYKITDNSLRYIKNYINNITHI